MARPCRLCPYFPAHAWRPSAFPGSLRRFALTYHSVGREEGYLQQCADRLVTNFSIGATALCIVEALFLASSLLGSPLSGLARDLFLVSQVSIAVNFVVALLMLVVARTPKLLGHVGLVRREVSVVMFAVLSSVQLVFTNEPKYLARVSGHNPCEVFGRDFCLERQDTVILLGLSVIIATTHLTLPIRWCVAWVVDAAVIAIYGIASLAFGGVFPTVLVAKKLGLLTFLTFLTATGKRQLEYTERLMFTRLVSEKTLRAKAEFELSQSQAADHRPGADDKGSMYTSTAGGIIRDIGTDDQHIESVTDIGRREHWLVGTEELSVDSREPPLGAGSFGVVVPGYFNNTPVALKLLRKPGLASSLADIGNELRILRKLRHPHIVGFHGACFNDEHRDIVMVLERIIGSTLKDFILSGDAATGGASSLPNVAARCLVLAGVSLALIYLHTRMPAVVHGDLKAGNIIVEHRVSGPHPRLLDFGLARMVTKGSKPLGGTLRWVAPEAFREHRPHPSADVFSFGRLIFFVVTGVLPLQSEDERKIRKCALRLQALPLAWPQDASSIVGRCQPLVESCSLVRPESRPTMSEVYEELGQWPEMRDTSFRAPERAATDESDRTHATAFWDSIRWIQGNVGLGEMPAKHTLTSSYRAGAPSPRPGSPQATERPLCHNDFRETPFDTRVLMVIGCIMRWNAVRSQCCGFHSLTKALEEVRQHIQFCECSQPNGPPVAIGESMSWFQCSTCAGMHAAENDSSEAPVCEHCGAVCLQSYDSPPRDVLQL